jgi:hypothetical protein
LLQQTTALDAYDLLSDLTYLADSVTDLRDQARDRADNLAKKDKAALEGFADDLDTLHGTLVVAGEGGLMSGKEQLRERLGNLFGEIVSYDGRPSDSQIERLGGLGAELAGKEADFETETAKIDGLNRTLAKRDLTPLIPLTREAWQEKQEGADGSKATVSATVWGLLQGL